MKDVLLSTTTQPDKR